MGYFSDKRKREADQRNAETNAGKIKTEGTCGCISCSGSSGPEEGMYGMYGAADMGMLPGSELSEERDFRMLQGMYPNEAKELLELVGEECDRMEYEGSPMFDEYPDYTTIYTLQKRIADAVRRKPGAASEAVRRKPGAAGEAARRKTGTMRDDAGAGMGSGMAAVNDGAEDAEKEAVPEDLIRVMLLQEMHRRRSRYRACRGVNAL